MTQPSIDQIVNTKVRELIGQLVVENLRLKAENERLTAQLAELAARYAEPDG